MRKVLRAEGVALGADSVGWGEAAAYLFDAWPRAQIIEALGPDLAQSIPPAFRPARVGWDIPAFIIRALQHQAALMRASDPRVSPAAMSARFISPSVDDYIADILYNEIQPGTVVALADDSAFVQAYHYPPLD